MASRNEEHKIVRQVPFELFGTFFEDLLVRAPYLYNIRDINGKNIPFVANQPQRIVHQHVIEETTRSMNNRGIVDVKLIQCKGRRMGLSTYSEVFIMDHMLNNDNTHAQVIAHDELGTATIYKMYKWTFEQLPHYIEFVDDKGHVVVVGGQKMIIPIRPSGKPNWNKMQFDDMTRSFLNIFTGGKGDAGGKGGALNCVHFSEVANFTAYEDVISSTVNQLQGDNTFGVKESTPNGVSGIGKHFYDEFTLEMRRWKQFEQGKTDDFIGWRPEMLPWYWMDEYRMPLFKGKKIDIQEIFKSNQEYREYLDWEEWIETQVIDTDPVTMAKDYDRKESTNWYRYIIINKSQKKLGLARRYYPTNPDEAFLSSDDCMFDAIKLHSVKIEVKDLVKVGVLTGDITSKGFTPNTTGKWRIQSLPKRNWKYRYILANDQAEGVQDGDPHGISVFDRLDQIFVAHWDDIIKEHEVPEMVLNAMYFYNEAFGIIEANRTHVINTLRPDGTMPYSGDLYYERTSRKRGRGGQIRYGFKTQGPSRKLLLSTYLEYLEENMGGTTTNYDFLFDEENIQQHISFIRQIRGGATFHGAAQGQHDEQVITNALCITGDKIWNKIPIYVGSRDEAEEDDDLMDIVNRDMDEITKKMGEGGIGVIKNSIHSQMGKNSSRIITVRKHGSGRQSKLGKR